MTTLLHYLVAFAAAVCLTLAVALDPIVVSDSDCPCCTVIVDCCEPPIPRTLYATIDSPGCAAIDGLVFPIVWNGSGSWVGSVETGCDACHTLTLTVTCSATVWSYSVAHTGTYPNPSPPPDDITCIANGISGGGCTAAITFDCETWTGEITYCLAALGDAPGSGSACCNTGGVATTIYLAA